MRTYRMPVLLSLSVVGGLLAALAFDGLVESLAVSCVGLPLLVTAYFYRVSNPRGHGKIKRPTSWASPRKARRRARGPRHER